MDNNYLVNAYSFARLMKWSTNSVTGTLCLVEGNEIPKQLREFLVRISPIVIGADEFLKSEVDNFEPHADLFSWIRTYNQLPLEKRIGFVLNDKYEVTALVKDAIYKGYQLPDPPLLIRDLKWQFYNDII